MKGKKYWTESYQTQQFKSYQIYQLKKIVTGKPHIIALCNTRLLNSYINLQINLHRKKVYIFLQSMYI